MNRNLFTVAAWFGIAAIFYCTMSIAELGQFNFAEWNILTRVTYGVLVIWLSAEMIAALVNGDENDEGN